MIPEQESLRWCSIDLEDIFLSFSLHWAEKNSVQGADFV